MNHQHSPTSGPYRIVRNHEGKKTYFAGHNTNGSVNWVDRQENAVRYPEPGLAATVRNALPSDISGSINVVRITG